MDRLSFSCLLWTLQRIYYLCDPLSKNYNYERGKSERDNPCIRLRDVDTGTDAYGDIFQDAQRVATREN